jgi:hypothetical protein
MNAMKVIAYVDRVAANISQSRQRKADQPRTLTLSVRLSSGTGTTMKEGSRGRAR